MMPGLNMVCLFICLFVVPLRQAVLTFGPRLIPAIFLKKFFGSNSTLPSS